MFPTRTEAIHAHLDAAAPRLRGRHVGRPHTSTSQLGQAVVEGAVGNVVTTQKSGASRGRVWALTRYAGITELNLVDRVLSVTIRLRSGGFALGTGRNYLLPILETAQLNDLIQPDVLQQPSEQGMLLALVEAELAAHELKPTWQSFELFQALWPGPFLAASPNVPIHGSSLCVVEGSRHEHLSPGRP